MKLNVVIDDFALRPKVVVTLRGAGEHDERAFFNPRAFDVERLETRGCDRYEVGVLERFGEFCRSDAFESVLRFSPVGEGLRLIEEEIVGYDFLDVRGLSDYVAEAGLVDGTASYDGADLGILASEVTRSDGGDSSGAYRAQDVGRHMAERRSGVLIVDKDCQYRARKPFSCIGRVRTVPLVSADVKASAEVCRHSEESAVGAGYRHVGERRFLREYYSHAVAVVVRAAHEIVALGEKPEDFLAYVDPCRGIGYAKLDGIRLRKVDKFDFMVHCTSLLKGLLEFDEYYSTQ